MTVATSQGLDRVKELYKDRSQRVRELKAEGHKIIGYLNTQPPIEMLTAVDLVPYAILGDMSDTITTADAYLPAMACPFLRSVLDQGLKGRYTFLDGALMAHPCEVGEKIAHMWRIYMKPEFEHYVDTPHTTHEAAFKQHRVQLEDLKDSLESYTGKKLSDERLQSAINLHNKLRAEVRALYGLTKSDPPLISGSEIMQTLLAVTGLPINEAIALVSEVIANVKQRRNGPKKQPARLLVWGSILDNSALLDLIEDTGANVVLDDTDFGSRPYFIDVDPVKDPVSALADHYLTALRSPRTFHQTLPRDTKKEYKEDLQDRFSYIAGYVRDWKINGVIMQVLRYCDAHAYEVPALREYLDDKEIPNIFVEHDYSTATVGQLRTRIQGFLEIID